MLCLVSSREYTKSGKDFASKYLLSVLFVDEVHQGTFNKVS